VRGAFRSLEKLIKQIFFETDASRQQLGHAHDPSHIPSEDLLLGAEPILFVMARFATAEFVKFIGVDPLSWSTPAMEEYLASLLL
jgi:hypothetical protein